MLIFFFILSISSKQFSVDKTHPSFSLHLPNAILSSVTSSKLQDQFSCRSDPAHYRLVPIDFEIPPVRSKFFKTTSRFYNEVREDGIGVVELKLDRKIEKKEVAFLPGENIISDTLNSFSFRNEGFVCSVVTSKGKATITSFQERTRKINSKSIEVSPEFQLVKGDARKKFIALMTSKEITFYRVSRACDLQRLDTQSTSIESFISKSSLKVEIAFSDFEFLNRKKGEALDQVCLKLLLLSETKSFTSQYCIGKSPKVNQFKTKPIASRSAKLRKGIAFSSTTSDFSIDYENHHLSFSERDSSLLKSKVERGIAHSAIKVRSGILFILMFRKGKNFVYADVKSNFDTSQDLKDFDYQVDLSKGKLTIFGRITSKFFAYRLETSNYRFHCHLKKQSHNFLPLSENYSIHFFNLEKKKFEESKIEVKWKFVKFDFWGMMKSVGAVVVAVGVIIAVGFAMGGRKKKYVKISKERKMN